MNESKAYPCMSSSLKCEENECFTVTSLGRRRWDKNVTMTSYLSGKEVKDEFVTVTSLGRVRWSKVVTKGWAWTHKIVGKLMTSFKDASNTVSKVMNPSLLTSHWKTRVTYLKFTYTVNVYLHNFYDHWLKKKILFSDRRK